ncbi:replication endonuclease, partial [Vibrio splendidus]
MSTYKRFHQPNITLSLSQYVSNLTAHLPVMMRQDLELKLGLRKKRSNPTDRNLALFITERVSFVDNVVHHFTQKFPFGFISHEPKPLELTHDILMSDDALKNFAIQLTVAFVDIINDIAVTDADDIPESPTDYYHALHY